MLRRHFIIICALLYLLVFAAIAHAQLPQIQSGISYLTSSQNSDGRWGSSMQFETVTTTVTALETLKTLNQTSGSAYISGSSWTKGLSLQGIDPIAERVRVMNISDNTLQVILAAFDPIKGAWGGDVDEQNNNLDTALALQALKSGSNIDPATINPALAYLIASQNPDGGWGFSPSTNSGQAGTGSNIYFTAIVSATLQQFPQTTPVATAVSRASAYLLARQNADGGFGLSGSTVYETALSYIALVAVEQTQTLALQNTINYLATNQSANGSWSDDPYSTALALRALYYSENKPASPPPPPSAGKLSGLVVDSITQQPVSGVSVSLAGNPLISVTSDSLGNFILTDVPPGSQGVNLAKNGFAPAAAAATAIADVTASLGTIPMTSSYSTGTIAGTISDATGKPLADVAVTVTGAWSGNATTGADGSYSFTYVTPGNVTISAAKTGYQTITAPGSVYARTTLSFSPRMSTTASQVTTGTLVGRVVDSYWGLPIDHLPGEKGMYVMLSGGISAEPDPNNRGNFTIANLAPGIYQVIVGMNGFASRAFRVVITPGVTTDLGTIRLDMSFLMTLTGKITDTSTGAPITGAEVTILGIDFTGRSDSLGTYAIADIPNPGQYTLKVSADGYIGKSYTIGSSPWLQTMDIALSPLVTKGSLTGTVIDAATGQPLTGVALTLASDPAIVTTTDSTGKFTFSAVPKGTQQTTIALSGYAPRTLTTTITVGAVNDVGTIALSVNQIPASVRGVVWNAGSNDRFAGVEMQVTDGSGIRQTITATDGTYEVDDVSPGEVTVSAASAGYFDARFKGTLVPGGILVFNPALYMMLAPAADMSLQTDKALYKPGETVAISINLQNRQASDYSSLLHLRVTDPSGASVYDTNVAIDLPADGALPQQMSFVLPAAAPIGTYAIQTELYDETGKFMGSASKSFGLATCQVSVTPTLPPVFSSAANTVSFNLTNTDNIAVSAGVLAVSLKDPDGQVVSASSQNFSLAFGESKTLTSSVSIPALKFGTYTLSYIQSDETKTGQATDISLPNTLVVSALYDDSSHRIRQMANLTVTLRNTGRFNLDTGSASQAIAVMAAVPDAAYTETKTLSNLPVAGSASGSTLLYTFAIPETIIPGQHGTRITVSLPSGSTTIQTTQLAIMESSLTLFPIQGAYTVGDTIHPVIANSGGVDAPVQYKLSLYDAKSALIAENSNTETAVAGSTLSLGLAIPNGAVDGNYNLMVNYKDLKTGKEGMVPNAVTISGVKGSLQVQTNKENYLLTENIAGTSSMTSSGTPLTGGNLHLQVTTGPGAQRSKTWTTQADFQTGVRSGVDTYGVNDWLIMDDDFNGSVIDKGKWLEDNYSINSQKLEAGVLKQTAGPGAGFASLLGNSYPLFQSDLDIQIDFNLINPSSVGESWAIFRIEAPSQEFRVLRLTASGMNVYYASYWNGSSWLLSGNFSTTDTSGKLRITKNGTTATAYNWENGTWRPIWSTNIWDGPSNVRFWTTNNNNNNFVEVHWDNFKVNAGRIVTKKETVDSVRLLPLNDNFDDGVLNLDRWASFGTAPVEGAGVLQLFSPPSATYSANGAFLRYSLPGDFVAYSKFSNFSAFPRTAVTGSNKDLAETVSLAATLEGTRAGFGIGRSSSDPSIATGEFIIGWRYTDSLVYSSWYNPRTSYPSDSGALRLQRNGANVMSDFLNDSGWTNRVTYNAMTVAPALLRLEAVVDTNPMMPSVQADMHYFYTTGAGTYATNGIISLKHDAGASNTKWGKLLYSSTQPVGTSIKFRTRTAETEAGLATATWSDYLTASGSTITSPAARWIEIESTLSTTNTNVTPLLNDLTVTYEANVGEILWQTDVSANMAQGAIPDVNKTIGTLDMTGKFYLEGTLTSSTGQTVASAEYPFFVEQGNIQVSLVPDKKIYRPGETVTITGNVANLSSIAATGLTARVQGTGLATPYAETFDLPANSAHPFSITTTAGNDGIYQLTGSVKQNSTILADIADQYEVASPVMAATLAAPDTVGNTPFTVSVSLSNTGKVSATISVHVVDDSGNVVGDQAVTLAAGESRILQYTRQITGITTFTAAVSGDLNRTLTKQVAYAVLASDSAVSGKIVTDKVSYNPNEQVTLTATLSASSTRDNLSALVTVTDSTGQGMYSATAAIPVLMQGQIVTNRNYWNSGTYPAGTYLVTLRILDPAGSVIARSTCNLTIASSTKPTALLKGQISLDKQSILTGEPVTVSYSVTNAGNMDLSNITLSVRTINLSEETVYNTISDQATLAMGANHTNNGLIDTLNYSAKDYLVVLRASIAGVEETLAGTYFRVEGAPSAPALVGPGNGTDVETFTPALTVGNAADPNDDKLTYEFELYADSGLTNPVASGAVPETAGSTAWVVPTALTENRTYYWRARAYDGRLYGSWMTPSSFRVNTVDDPPTAPTVSSPADASSVAVLSPMLTVNNASDPDSTNLTYNFDLALDPDFIQIVASEKGIPGGPGATSWQVPLPLVENGWYYWRAQADDWLIEGPWSTTARFFVNTANEAPSLPIVTAPTNGSTITALATDVVVSNSSDPDSPTLTYYFEADTVPTFDSTNIIRSGSVAEGQGSTLWHLVELRDNTGYYIRAKASDGSADSQWSAITAFIANTFNDPPTTPILANPSNGAGVNVFTPTLSAHNSIDPDRDVLTYEFALYVDAAMTNLVAQAAGIVETGEITSWTTPVTLTENMTYYWHARASDGALTSSWTPTATFTVNTANDAPGSPTLSSPAPGSSVATLTPTLAVMNAVDPDSDTLTYEFEIYAGTTLVASISGVPQDNSGVTAWVPASPLNDNTACQWRARAYDGDRFGPWTAMAAFTVHQPKTSITATIDFDPDTLNKSSNGTWVVVYIELPAGYKPADIDIASIRLEGTIAAETRPSAIGDHDKDGIPDLMVKFKRSGAINLLKEGDIVPVHVTGKVGSTQFDGVDVIRVIQ